MKKVIGMLALAMVLGQTVYASSATIECTAKGNSLSQNGSGLLPAKAKITFNESFNSDGLRVIEKIEGKIEAACDEENNCYVGNFDAASIVENPNYRPNQYKGFSQFKNFDANNTDGSAESGMWGSFLLEKNTDKATFNAHYIFQAGDHMGGTLHLTCRYAD